jgi:hypothetical protein
VVGRQPSHIRIAHVADVELESDEQVTFKTARGQEYDVVRKSWGYYATPSLNGRLTKFGLRPALVAGAGRRYLLLVEHDRIEEFQAYLDAEGMVVIGWLDDPDLNVSHSCRGTV